MAPAPVGTWTMIKRQVLLGTWLGLLVLGIGGRLVMRWIAVATGVPGSFSVGGTVTVLASGTAAGVAGALMYALSGAIAKRVPRNERVVRLAIFGLLLALVTARGLQGTASGPSVAFWPLVALYGALFVALSSRQSVTTDSSPPGRSRRWPLRFNRAPGNVR